MVLAPKLTMDPMAVARPVDIITKIPCLKPRFKVYNTDKLDTKEATS
jgi:hypothetical protein